MDRILLAIGPRQKQMRLLAALCFWFIFALRSVYAIRCVQCTSLVSKDCLKPNLPSSECRGSSAGAKYCLMYIALINEGVGSKFIFRHCSGVYMDKPYCRATHIENAPVRACYVTCRTNGCNNDGTVSDILQVAANTYTDGNNASANDDARGGGGGGGYDMKVNEFIVALTDHMTSGALVSSRPTSLTTSARIMTALITIGTARLISDAYEG